MVEERSIVKDIKEIIDENVNGKVVETNGRTYLFDKGSAREITEKEYLIENTIRLTDLKSFCKIIQSELLKMNEKLFIQIVSPTKVIAITSLDVKNRRFIPYECVCDRRDNFDTWQCYEEFVINLRANFEPTEDTNNVIKMIANIVNCDNQELTDDGITQTVRTQRGTQVGQQDVKSIVKLAPFRTFADVKQPCSEFLFRIKDNGNRFGLFQADGGRWELDAKYFIAEFLHDELKNADKVEILF